MTNALRGRFVEASSARAEETTGFNLEDATIVGANSEEAGDLERSGETVNLDMPSAVSAENWVGKEVVVEGSFEATSTGEAAAHRVFRVESIDEAQSSYVTGITVQRNEGGCVIAAGEKLGEEHLKLLRIVEELASNDPAGVAQINKAAQKISLDSVGKEADREEYERLSRELEEVGYVVVPGTEQAASYGQLSVTEEGRQRLERDGQPRRSGGRTEGQRSYGRGGVPHRG